MLSRNVLRQFWLDNLTMQWYKSLGQHFTGFQLCNGCAKSIKITLNRIFSYAIVWSLEDNTT